MIKLNELFNFLVKLSLDFQEISYKGFVLSFNLVLECVDLLEENSSCLVDFNIST